MRIKYFGGCKIWLDSIYQLFFLHLEHDFVIFLIPCIINSYMEAL